MWAGITNPFLGNLPGIDTIRSELKTRLEIISSVAGGLLLPIEEQAAFWRYHSRECIVSLLLSHGRR